jgi:hypothetical protein
MTFISWTILVLFALLVIYVGSLAARYAARYLAPLFLAIAVTTVVALAVSPRETTQSFMSFADWLGSRVQIITDTLKYSR